MELEIQRDTGENEAILMVLFQRISAAAQSKSFTVNTPEHSY